jgi:hypothetical protein
LHKANLLSTLPDFFQGQAAHITLGGLCSSILEEIKLFIYLAQKYINSPFDENYHLDDFFVPLS